MSYQQPPPGGYQPYPQYPQYPYRRERPFGVTILAVLEAIVGILYIIGGLLLIAGGTFIVGFMMHRYRVPIGLPIGTIVMVAGIIVLLLGIIALVMAKGLWDGKGWAWTITLILSVLGLIIGLASLIFSPSAGALIPLLINILIIYYLTRPHVKAFFGKGYVPPPPPPPPQSAGYPQY